jgi:hypothetical protein
LCKWDEVQDTWMWKGSKNGWKGLEVSHWGGWRQQNMELQELDAILSWRVLHTSKRLHLFYNLLQNKGNWGWLNPSKGLWFMLQQLEGPNEAGKCSVCARKRGGRCLSPNTRPPLISTGFPKFW